MSAIELLTLIMCYIIVMINVFCVVGGDLRILIIEIFIMRSSIGESKSHMIQTALKGGFEYMGATFVDYENVRHNVISLVENKERIIREPKLVITDQCATMKQVVLVVFMEYKHRLYAWHKYKKLHVNDWVANMYAISQSWIFAYFKDDPTTRLLRTMPRSKSSMHTFGCLCHLKMTLFKQRNKQSSLEFVTRNMFPMCVTRLCIERHASEVYTRVMFFMLKRDTKIVFNRQDGDVKRYVVSHKSSRSITKISYELMVVHDVSVKNFEC
ncbi:LOW QUALITY PROTEIN: hypothetical protein OSB04_012316 [Centaurea solstitialis]|uniref:Protein FAR1-RELATED SEQUENCE n=1 Tax=Centaurea solstitialis TaxID=347529 RepID=A0AA38WEH6_9ASTR|nr:LOW QUALITY PROTEIN: hypothetical protein OSB04_012316 [Centaurea solstitialis]